MYYIGHKNPDTDAICSAIAAAHLYNGTPARCGELNKETEFVLKYFKLPLPELITDASGKEIGLVDHNQRIEAVDGAEKAAIKKIIDHHALLNAMIVTSQPIEVLMKPWGSTSTIIAQEHLQSKKEIPQPIAGAMLAGVLSDTLALQSPTATEKDKEIVGILTELAEIRDFKAFAKEMFQAKSNIGNLSAQEILMLDYKDFDLNGKKLGCGVAETVTPEALLPRKSEFLAELKKLKDAKNLDYSYFIIVDILNSHADLLIIDTPEQQLAETVFGGSTKDNVLDIGGRISRKKQFIAPISEYLSKA